MKIKLFREFLLVATLASPGCGGGKMPAKDTVGSRAPEFPRYDAARWINTEPLTMEGLRGHIVVIDFWEYTCVNCIRTLPYVKEWHRRYAPLGVVFVGVHAPEFEFGKERANVERAARDFGLTYPIVMDNDYEIWRLYANSYWPRKYVVDPKGRVVYDHIGEGGYGETEEVLQNLIRAQRPDAPLPPIMEPVRPEDGPGAVCYPRTPELYCGFLRGRYGNAEPAAAAGIQTYADPRRHTEGYLYLQGKWRLGSEEVTSAAGADGDVAAAYLLLPFSGNEVNAVMRAEVEGAGRLAIQKDGAPLSVAEAGEDIVVTADGAYIDVTAGRMYRVYENAEYGSGELSLHPLTPGVSIYAFTFGSCAAK